MKFRKKKTRNTRPSTGRRFAWLPRRLDNGDTVWLGFYHRYRIGVDE